MRDHFVHGLGTVFLDPLERNWKSDGWAEEDRREGRITARARAAYHGREGKEGWEGWEVWKRGASPIMVAIDNRQQIGASFREHPCCTYGSLSFLLPPYSVPSLRKWLLLLTATAPACLPTSPPLPLVTRPPPVCHDPKSKTEKNWKKKILLRLITQTTYRVHLSMCLYPLMMDRVQTIIVAAQRKCHGSRGFVLFKEMNFIVKVCNHMNIARAIRSTSPSFLRPR